MHSDEMQLQAQALVRRYFAGDERLLPELMDVYRNLVVAAARRVVRSSSDVEDAVQETWLTFVRNGHRIEDQSRVGAWLWTVSMNNARRIQRASRRTFASADVDTLREELADVIDFDIVVHAGERHRALVDAAATLSDRDRDMLALFLDDRDFDYREISARSGRPIGSLGPTRDRIIRKMRASQPLAEMLAAS
jgi:RNA polymerase sigma factor (sigma-70 family)